jgi:hypothetical protein
MFGVTVNAVAFSANKAKDAKFDFTKFDPTGFADAVKNSADQGATAAKVASGWLGFAANFDPTGWLSVAAAFAKPKCKVKTGEQQAFHKHHPNHLCFNRGGVGGSNQFSKNVGSRNPQACANYVHSVQGCGSWFSYGFLDGWCDCVRETSANPEGYCKPTTKGSAAKNQYAIYEIRESQPFEQQADNEVCSNRNRLWAKNVGPDNVQACADYAHYSPGCGSWFDYGKADGWCNCVSPRGGVCQLTPKGEYGVYKVGVTHGNETETETDIPSYGYYHYR